MRACTSIPGFVYLIYVNIGDLLSYVVDVLSNRLRVNERLSTRNVPAERNLFLVINLD